MKLKILAGIVLCGCLVTSTLPVGGAGLQRTLADDGQATEGVTWEDARESYEFLLADDTNEVDPVPAYCMAFEDSRDPRFVVHHRWLYFATEPATGMLKAIEQMPGGSLVGGIFRHEHDIEGAMFIVGKESRCVEYAVYSWHGWLRILPKPSLDQLKFSVDFGKHSISAGAESGHVEPGKGQGEAFFADEARITSLDSAISRLEGLHLTGLPLVLRADLFSALEKDPGLIKGLAEAGDAGKKWVPIYPLIEPGWWSGLGVPVPYRAFPGVKLGEDVVGLAQDVVGGVDLRSARLTYVAVSSDPGSDEQWLRYVVRMTEGQDSVPVSGLEDLTEPSLACFLTGLALPNEAFWVNLNPWEPDRVIDEGLAGTDVGRIMLEADLQMKRDFCKYEDPAESDVGIRYWQLLDEKQEELVRESMREYPGQIRDAGNVLFQATTRHWIVPDHVTAYGDGDEVYVVDASLDIYSEPVYEHSTFRIVGQSESSLSTACRGSLAEAAKEYGRYAREVEEQLVLPLVVGEVNSSSRYHDLRQVCFSLALAQWYKERFADVGVLSGLVNSSSLSGLQSEETWNPMDVWEEYVKSYEEGEYHYEQETSHREGAFVVVETRVYSGGGVDFSDIATHISLAGDIPGNTKELLEGSAYVPLLWLDGGYCLGDYLSLSAAGVVDTQDWTKLVLTVLVLAIIVAGYVYFYRRRKRARQRRNLRHVPRRL